MSQPTQVGYFADEGVIEQLEVVHGGLMAIHRLAGEIPSDQRMHLSPAELTQMLQLVLDPLCSVVIEIKKGYGGYTPEKK